MEDKKRQEEEQRRLAEEQKRIAEEQKRKEEQERLAEAARIEAERKAAEEKARLEEEARLEEARLEEERKAAERKAEDERQKIENEKKSADVRPSTGKIKVFVLDDVKGKYSFEEDYFQLSENGKKMVQNSELYVHSIADGASTKHLFISKEEYMSLYIEFDDNKQDPVVQSNGGEITVYILDEKDCEKIQVLSRIDFPQPAHKHIVDGEVFIRKALVDGKISSVFITKAEYQELKKSLETKILEKTEIRVQEKSKESFEQEVRVNQGDIIIHIIDERNTEKTQVLPRVDFPQAAHRHIVGNEVFICKALVDGKVSSTFISKEEFESMKLSVVKETTISNCPFCGIPIGEGDVFCANCGNKVANIKRCKKCGKFNDINDSFCANCGVKL